MGSRAGRVPHAQRYHPGVTLCALTSRAMWVAQFGAEVRAERTLPHRIPRLAEFFGLDLQGHPRLRTTRHVMALRPGRLTLASFTAGQWLDPAVELFALPTHGARGCGHLRRHGLREGMGDAPVHVAVWGE